MTTDALILAAGRGERLRPLTDNIPKPLLTVGGRSLIEHRVHALVEAGVSNIVINLSHLGAQIKEHLGDGTALGAHIIYSDEPRGALETGGGIVQALPMLHSDPFLVVNADIWTDLDFADLPASFTGLAFLVLVDNPEHHPHGDFRLDGEIVRTLDHDRGPPLTFSGIGLYHRELFRDARPGRFPLAPLLFAAARRGAVCGRHYRGRWTDIGTMERLHQLRKLLGE